MKDYYKINEIAKLYGIGVDSLRYYERLGILKPRRDTNGYRLYSLKEMYKLNMIRDLRRLNFSMEQIKAYLEGQTVDNTLHLLRQEADLVQEQLRELQAKAVLLEKRVATLEAARRVVPGVVARKTLPPRPCVLFTEHITRDEEMDFVMKKLHRQHEDKIRDFGNQIFGAFLAMEELMAGTPNVYDGVFSVVEEDTLVVATDIFPQSLENSSQVAISLEPINILIPQLLFTISATVSPYTLFNWA